MDLQPLQHLAGAAFAGNEHEDPDEEEARRDRLGRPHTGSIWRKRADKPRPMALVARPVRSQPAKVRALESNVRSSARPVRLTAITSRLLRSSARSSPRHDQPGT